MMILPLESGGLKFCHHSTIHAFNVVNEQFVGASSHRGSIDAKNGRGVPSFDYWPEETGSSVGIGEEPTERI